jgi:hypothetical protein
LSRRRRIALSYLTNVDGLTGRGGKIKTKHHTGGLNLKHPLSYCLISNLKRSLFKNGLKYISFAKHLS